MASLLRTRAEAFLVSTENVPYKKGRSLAFACQMFPFVRLPASPWAEMVLNSSKSMPAESFSNVTVHTKANVYFDGKVVSHTVLMASGERKTLGLIYPGEYHFGTGAAELMEIVAGECSVVLDGQTEKQTYAAGAEFTVPGNSGFTIAVPGGICEYICTFLS